MKVIWIWLPAKSPWNEAGTYSSDIVDVMEFIPSRWLFGSGKVIVDTDPFALDAYLAPDKKLDIETSAKVLVFIPFIISGEDLSPPCFLISFLDIAVFAFDSQAGSER